MTRILITGFTGTLGTEVVSQLKNDNMFSLLGVSRDEQKQGSFPYPLRKEICDIRDRPRLRYVMDSFDPHIILHFAALKCVSTGETHPFETVKTNIIGTQNIIETAPKNAKIIMSSTDKAFEPINAYGQTKAIAETMVLNAFGTICRYGNVVGSRGSVLPIFVKQILEVQSVTITDVDMTRFWIKIEDAAAFILDSMTKPSNVYVPNIKSCSIVRLAESIGRILNKPVDIDIIGAGPGEKIHEWLNLSLSSSEDNLTDCEIDKLIGSKVKEIVNEN
jgi:FlaA1/EpsC-like NDP-sugar epimerase